MPVDIEVEDLYEDAVLWPFTGHDDQGSPTVGPPEELTVRWVEDRKDMTNSVGEAVSTRAQVVVDRDIDINSQMWYGSLSDWYGTGSAGDETNVMVVVAKERIPDTKARSYRRLVGLNRYKA